jgi:hypothetical protein
MELAEPECLPRSRVHTPFTTSELNASSDFLKKTMFLSLNRVSVRACLSPDRRPSKRRRLIAIRKVLK